MEYSVFINSYLKSHGRKVITRRELKPYATYLLVSLCLPTLLRIKPSSLLHLNKNKISDTRRLITLIEHELVPFECSYSILYENESMLLLLVYIKDQLTGILSEPDNVRFLAAFGYLPDKDPVSSAINHIKIRYKYFYDNRFMDKSHDLLQREYPHEIGIFLGFPIWDVEDFIKFRGTNYLICGCWKVYHNVEEAARLFESYRAVREYVTGRIMDGVRLRDLSIR